MLAPAEQPVVEPARLITRLPGVQRWVDQHGIISLAGFCYRVPIILAGEPVEAVVADHLVRIFHRDVLVAEHVQRRKPDAEPREPVQGLRSARKPTSGMTVTRVADGNGPSRLRLINGMGLDVLPRLTDGGYDLVFVDATPTDHPRYLDESLRLLRPGGIVAINGVTPDGLPESGTVAGQAPAAAQEVAKQVRADDQLAPVLLPLGDGLLAAVKKA